MPWIRLDENAMDHPKLVALSNEAFRLWVYGLAHCQRFLTDGVISKVSLRGLRFYTARRHAEIISVGLWEVAEDGIRVHDYLQWNESRASVLESREWGKRRRELHSDPALLATIRLRDGDACRYCGKHVNWKDRRGPDGGTYDHVIARGPNTAENVVVACRGCNSSKGDRTLEECRMSLLPILQARPNLDSSQNGVSHHISGVVCSLPQPSSLEEREGSLRETISERAGEFCRWYEDTHQRLFGVGYMGSNGDYGKACEMARKFSDSDLRDGAVYWFGQRDEFASRGTRSIVKFASRASDCVLKAKLVAS